MNKYFIVLFFLLFSNISFSNEKPSQYPFCDDNLNSKDWNDCYKEVTYRDGFKYHGEWKRGLFHGKGKFINPDGIVDEGEWIEGKKEWQLKYRRNKHLQGIWGIENDYTKEQIYIFEQWIGFLNNDHVCRILATETPFIKITKNNKYNINNITFIVLLTNCKDNKFKNSFDNIFIGNEGNLVFFQMKELEANEEVNPILNPTFPNQYFYESFEKNKVNFVTLKKIRNTLTEEEFLKTFNHKFSNQ